MRLVGFQKLKKERL